MKAVILAGGFGTRISEESTVVPKPMIEIGGEPILWHIMKHYSLYGINDFIILCGYKGHLIKEYFLKYYLKRGSIKFDLERNHFDFFNTSNIENWTVTCLDTGLNTLTGGRIEKAKEILGSERFYLTYGDGVSDVNLTSLLNSHITSTKTLTITAVLPEGRFGRLDIGQDNVLLNFKEKPKGDGAWINGGFMVCEPEVFNYLENAENTMFEGNPMEKMATLGQINCYKHAGFWKCMDTLSDKKSLESLWLNGNPPWKTWD